MSNTDTEIAILSVAALTVVDVLVKKHTAFESMQKMADAKGYRPTIRTSEKGALGAELKVIADIYDLFQNARGDDRRAFRQ